MLCSLLHFKLVKGNSESDPSLKATRIAAGWAESSISLHRRPQSIEIEMHLEMNCMQHLQLQILNLESLIMWSLACKHI